MPIKDGSFIQMNTPGPVNDVKKPGSKAAKVKSPKKKMPYIGKRKGSGKKLAGGKERGAMLKTKM